MHTAEKSPDVDVVVVGAGMSGLFAIKALRDRGLTAVVLEKAPKAGGTWYWNRYPGARCDIPSLEYSFGFDPELEQEWVWTEHFPPQPEIEAYLDHLAERYDLARDIRYSTGVTAMTFDEPSGTWLVETDTDDHIRARFCVMATGGLSAPYTPSWPGLDSFAGTVVQTSLWPEEGVDLEGKRIGIVGTGSSGVQAIPELAKLGSHLTVFQRTPTFTWPSRNRALTDEEQAAVKARYPQLREEQRNSFTATAGTTGAVILAFPTGERRILDSTPEEREAALAEHGFDACRIWSDTASNLEANEMAVELYREMIRRTVRDPETAEKLSPRGFPLGCKRPVLDNGYFETFNRDDVTLVALRDEPIVEFTPDGVRTSDRFIALDVLVLATGFDAMTGALTRIDLQGRDGRRLRDDWADGARAYLGIGIEGYPNLFHCVGPGSAGVLATYPPHIELQVGWIVDTVRDLVDRGVVAFEADRAAQDAWCDEVARLSAGTMYVAPTCVSWYNGGNIDGKARTFPLYLGGVPTYMERLRQVTAADYEGFRIT